MQELASTRDMTDDELIEQFENTTLHAECFHHADHVRAAFVYLSRCPVLEALHKFSTALKRFAAAKGKPQLYHENITWAYIFLIRERMARSGCAQTWQEFRRNNPELLQWKDGILHSYYSPETLKSDLARRIFVLPDKLA
ncbi:MAG TPA: hypothetical protein VH744_13275 [Terriglobales bacterium]|jgi:hypothetical protein